MKRYEAADKMAPHDKAGLIGKASPRTSSVADTRTIKPQKIAPRLADEKRAGARLVIFTCEHRNQWRDHG